MESKRDVPLVQLNVRVPAPMKRKLQEYAAASGLTLNTAVTLIFAQHLDKAGWNALATRPTPETT